MPIALPQNLGIPIEHRQDGVTALRWQAQDHPCGADVPVSVHQLLVTRGPEDRDGDRLHVTPRLGGSILELCHALGDQLRVATAWEPAFAIVDYALQCVGAFATEQHGRMWLLSRFGPAPEQLKIHELAVELGNVLGPDLFHGAHLLDHLLKPRLEHRAVMRHLFSVPATTDAKEKTAARKPIEAGDLFSGNDCIALDDEANASAQLEILGHRCG